MQNVLLILLGAFSAVALEIVAAEVCVWLLRPRGARGFIIFSASGECPELESQLRWLRYCIGAHPSRRNQRILLLDTGLCEDALSRARAFAGSRRDIVICKPEQLKRILGYDLVCKELELVLY